MASTTFPVATSPAHAGRSSPSSPPGRARARPASTAESLQTTLDRATAANDGDLVIDLSGVEFTGLGGGRRARRPRARLAAQARSWSRSLAVSHPARILQVCGTLVDPASIAAHGLTKRYGSSSPSTTCRSTSAPGGSPGSWAPTAPVSPPPCAWSWASTRPPKGAVTISGRAYRSLRRPLFQVGAMLEAALHEGRTAYNHLRCIAQSNGIGRRRVDDVLALVGLDRVAHRGPASSPSAWASGSASAWRSSAIPELLIFDEPVNGARSRGHRLDPHPDAVVRRPRAAPVFVSSHLMAEMALTADHVIVIGRGRLLAETTVEATDPEQLAELRARPLPADHGAGAAPAGERRVEHRPSRRRPRRLRAVGVDHRRPRRRPERRPARAVAQEASLEEAYMELTHDSVEYRSEAPDGAAPAVPARREGGMTVTVTQMPTMGGAGRTKPTGAPSPTSSPRNGRSSAASDRRYWTLFAAAATTIGLSAIVCGVYVAQFAEISAEERAEFDPASFSVTGGSWPSSPSPCSASSWSPASTPAA